MKIVKLTDVTENSVLYDEQNIFFVSDFDYIQSEEIPHI